MNTNYFFFYETPVGILRIAEENNSITEISFLQEKVPIIESTLKETPLLKRTFSQLQEYFSKTRTTFDLPLNPKGTTFQKKVWDALITIPYGETRSYKQIAEQVNCPKGSRAVGLANHNNPIAIIIPCHRVIGVDGKLVGYAGGLSIKETLLQIENN